MRICSVVTACIRERDNQLDLYRWWSTQGHDVLVIGPRRSDPTKGLQEAPPSETLGRLRVERVFEDIPDMWGPPERSFAKAREVFVDFRPDVLWVWHEANFPFSHQLAQEFSPPVPMVLYLEIPTQKIMDLARIFGEVPFTLSAVLLDKLREAEMTRPGTWFLKMEIPVGTAAPPFLPREKRLKRGIFCGSLGYPYKGPDQFEALLPRLFAETPMERLLMVSPGNARAVEIYEKYRDRYPIDFVESMPRQQLHAEIARSAFGFHTMTIESPASFCVECMALGTPFLAAESGLGGVIEDGVTGLRSVDSLNRALADPDFYAAVQRGAHDYYLRHFSLESVGWRTLALFQGILDGNPEAVWERLRYRPGQTLPLPAAVLGAGSAP
jgi:hypothetical protein